MTNSKQTRKALLSSVVALLLCFSMLLGTTFAWFTDTATTRVNTIQAGTLDVELLDAQGHTLEGSTLAWQKANGSNDPVLWEPGCTYSLQPITIKNSGNLALKYKVAITGIDGDTGLASVIDWTVEIGENEYTLGSDMHLTAGASDTLTISAHMQETAGNAYMGLSIQNVAITVYATQDTVEYDSNNNTYDRGATYATLVSTEAELTAALENGGSVVLTDDIELSGYVEVKENTTIDLSNYEISRPEAGATGIYVNTDGTVLNIYGNGKVTAESVGVYVAKGTANIYGGTYTSLQTVYVQETGSVNIYGGTFKSENAQYGSQFVLNQRDTDRTTSSIKVYGGTFIGFNPANNTAEGPDTNFVADGYTVVENNNVYYVVPENATTVSTPETLASAIQNGGSAVLTGDVTASDIINITKDVTIYGCGNTISAAGGKDRVFNVQETSNNISIKLDNVTLDAPNAERGISFYGNTGKIVLEMNNCTVTADHYAVNVASNNTDIEVIAKNSNITGYCAAQTWSANSKLTFENCTLNGVNRWDGVDNDFSTVNVVNTAANAVVTLTNCTIQNITSGTANQTFIGIATNATVTATGCTYTKNGTTVTAEDLRADTSSTYVYIPGGITYTLTIN